MLPMTLEWVRKAESDYNAVLLLLKSRKPDRFDTICFHCQQCMEKYLKGRFVEAGLPFPKTHDLVAALSLVVSIEPLWAVFSAQMTTITKWAVLPRYPGVLASTPKQVKP